MKDKIKKSLDDYLEFDSDLLFNRTPIDEYSIKLKRLVRIFGGAIRDIIAEQQINDVDILVGAQSSRLVELTLKEQGYTYMESLTPKDLSSIYSDIKVINEPRTWVKGNKIVQLIRPVVYTNDFIEYERGFRDLISNVDFSCCGVSWDGELYEDYPNAILHCQSKVFSINIWAKMYHDARALKRRLKLQERGWEVVEDKIDINRCLKLGLII